MVTLPSQSRKARGMASQSIAAQWFRDHGWPYAESTGAGRSGVDLTGTPGIACEVKARANLDPVAWIRQAKKDSRQGLPFVLFRPNGFGPAAIADWPVFLTLADFTDLLHAAGYGDAE